MLINSLTSLRLHKLHRNRLKLLLNCGGFVWKVGICVRNKGAGQTGNDRHSPKMCPEQQDQNLTASSHRDQSYQRWPCQCKHVRPDPGRCLLMIRFNPRDWVVNCGQLVSQSWVLMDHIGSSYSVMTVMDYGNAPRNLAGTLPRLCGRICNRGNEKGSQATASRWRICPWERDQDHSAPQLSKTNLFRTEDTKTKPLKGMKDMKATSVKTHINLSWAYHAFRKGSRRSRLPEKLPWHLLCLLWLW